MSENSTNIEDLQAFVSKLVERIGALEKEVAGLKVDQDVPEEDMVAISAAVAAFLGHKAKVKAVSFSNRGSWSREARGRVHNRQVLKVR